MRTNQKIKKIAAIFVAVMATSFSSFSTEKYIEQTICFEDRKSGMGVNVDNDANDVCVSTKIIYDNNWQGSGMGPITVLMTPLSLGASDNIQLILNPNLPTTGGAEYSLHYENAYSVISPSGGNGVLYNKGDLFNCVGGFVNVGTGNDCDPNPRAVTLEVGHNLNDGFTLADVLALKNVTQSNTIISKSTAGSNVWVFPGLAAPVKEYQGTWYNAYNVSAVSVTGDCDPSSANFNTCTSTDLNNIAAHMSTIVRSSLDANVVNKTPPAAKEFAIAQASGNVGTVSGGGTVVFNGSAWSITSASANIGNYFGETRSDGSGGTFQNFNIYKRRPICKIISCSGGGGGPAPSSGCSAPGNAPCDYSFCGCYTTQTGCESGDPNGDNACYWTGSDCRGADNLTTQGDCESNGFYWNWESAQSAYKCVGGNTGPHNCNSPTNSCTFMGKMDNSGNSCTTTHRVYGNISVNSYSGSIGTSGVSFGGAASFDASPSGKLPDYANCTSSGQCESGTCNGTTYRCE